MRQTLVEMCKHRVGSFTLRGWLTLAFFVASLIVSSTAHGQDSEEKPVEKTYLPTAEVTCKIGSKERVEMSATQAAGGELLTVILSNCRYSDSSSSGTRVSVDMEVRLNRAADISLCSSFSTAFLFRLSSTTPDLDWDGKIFRTDELPIKNLNQDVSDLSNFFIYAGKAPGTSLGEALFPKGAIPDFREYFWGKVVVLKEDSQGALGGAIFEHLPISVDVADKKFPIELRLDVFQPKGWCVVPEGAPAPAVRDLVFSEK
ncbi:hypothetical protein J3R80_13635 [Aliiroseovarius sp. Z3]|uniref:hypothetical protein n=1 Tax=Aliiroseovarius sp. Z3 TaxID=2811402 RepID=UPI0023B2BA8D|nr:hypothetical protein [Aliiroseovarius sp. Z3]MDE9451510.1 hypothetical protein [Aliiroseovarius sp. Z3]